MVVAVASRPFFYFRMTAQTDFTELTDEELVQLAIARRGSDDRPFRVLFARHKKMIWRACYRFVHNSEDAEDLTQDVFVKAYRSMAQFQGKASFKTWLYRIAINTSQNELRRRSRRPVNSSTTIDDLAEVLPQKDSPESIWLKNERMTLLKKALAELRSADSEIIYLKDIHQKPYIEIAETLDISVSAAKMRVQRARAALKEAYVQLQNGGAQ